jgi:hypothetical protein
MNDFDAHQGAFFIEVLEFLARPKVMRSLTPEEATTCHGLIDEDIGFAPWLQDDRASDRHRPRELYDNVTTAGTPIFSWPASRVVGSSYFLDIPAASGCAS